MQPIAHATDVKDISSIVPNVVDSSINNDQPTYGAEKIGSQRVPQSFLSNFSRLFRLKSGWRNGSAPDFYFMISGGCGFESHVGVSLLTQPLLFKRS